MPEQEAAYAGLMSQFSQARVWRDAGAEAPLAYERFRSRLPLCTHEQLAPHVARMRRGERDVLWPGACQVFAATSGTSTGVSYAVPATGALLDHYRRSSIDSMLWYASRVGSSAVFRGHQLFLGGSIKLAPIPSEGAAEAFEGEMSAALAYSLPPWAERHFIEPSTDIAQLNDFGQKVDAIVEKYSHADISALGGIPSWVLLLADALRARATRGKIRVPHLQGLWPKFECYLHGGEPITPHLDELRAGLGPTVNFHEVYAAAEGFVAAQDGDASAGLRLMTGAGLFFEFLPMEDFDAARLASLGAKAVPLSGVQTGVDYALIASTPAGFARLVLGDVVRFRSTDPHRIVYVGRTGLRLDAFGERVTESNVADTLVNVCRRNGWTIVNFHVAPLFLTSTTGKSRGRHEWWVELKPGTLTTPTGPVMAPELDVELRRLNHTYETLRARGVIEPPFVRLVMPGVFEHWLRHHGKWGGQSKMPRCSCDRVIAEELDSAVQFAKD